VTLRSIQCVDRPGMLDLGYGLPLPAALPVEDWRAATEEALRTYSWQALTYGYEAGPGPLVEWLCERLGQTDARAPVPAEVFVTAGASQAIELVSTVLTRPGDAILVDSPTYHLALGIFADRGAELIGAPADDEGIDPRATADLLRRLHRAGRRVPLLYLVPTFANPTGVSLPDARRRELVEVVAETGTVVLEDDTYREIAYDGPAPQSLWSIDPAAVVRVGSFAKTVAPGLRLGFLTATPAFVRTLVGRGYVHSGGGLNHATAFAMAVMGTSGRYAAHVEAVRQRYRHQRDALVAALRTEVAALDVTPPRGGWFLWLRLPAGMSATGLLAAAEAHAVSFLPGNRFYAQSAGDDHVRLSFSMLEPAVLAEAARRLGRAFTTATTRYR
jgi:2-aminoadipate transaminase